MVLATDTPLNHEHLINHPVLYRSAISTSHITAALYHLYLSTAHRYLPHSTHYHLLYTMKLSLNHISHMLQLSQHHMPALYDFLNTTCHTPHVALQLTQRHLSTPYNYLNTRVTAISTPHTIQLSHDRISPHGHSSIPASHPTPSS